MGSVPKPAHIEIRVDEWRAAQKEADAVKVEVSWRGVRKHPALAELLKQLPPHAEFTRIKLADGRVKLAPESWRRIRFGGGPPIFESARKNYEVMGEALHEVPALKEALDYVTRLARGYVPDFDGYSEEQQADFIILTQEKINSIYTSVDGLIAHLEHAGSGKHKPYPPLRNPRHNVLAAVFRDVLGSTNRAGELLGVPCSRGDEDRDENQRVRKAADLGRELLLYYFGEEEWRLRVERMGEYRKWWEHFESINTPEEEFFALLAKARGTSPEDEKHFASKDGFKAQLGEWIALGERKEKADETYRHAKNDEMLLERSMREANELADRIVDIEEGDQRFALALSVFRGPPPTCP